MLTVYKTQWSEYRLRIEDGTITSAVVIDTQDGKSYLNEREGQFLKGKKFDEVICCIACGLGVDLEAEDLDDYKVAQK